MASGFLVSSTDPASARNSRERDNANRITLESSQATAISAMAITMAMKFPPLPRSLSPSLERRERKPVLNHSRKNISAKNAIPPAMITAMTSMRTSPLRMWVSSWPSTASSSASSSAASSPVVTVMAYCFSFMPVAKALRASLSITLSLGMVMPREVQRFSSRL